MPRKNPADTAEYQRRYRKANPEKTRAAGKRFRTQNPESFKKSQAKYKKKYPERIKASWRKWAGIPNPTRPQSDRCNCCKRLFKDIRLAPHVDHDHKTGVFRGWLCISCNVGIGCLGDDIEGLQAAISYLMDAELLS